MLAGLKSIPPLDTMFHTWHNAKGDVIRREESDPRLRDGRSKMEEAETDSMSGPARASHKAEASLSGPGESFASMQRFLFLFSKDTPHINHYHSNKMLVGRKRETQQDVLDLHNH